MIHDIDIILSIIRSGKKYFLPAVAVMTDTPDIANVRIRFNNGYYSQDLTNISMKKMLKIRLFKDGYIGIDFHEKKTRNNKNKTARRCKCLCF